MLLEVLLKEAGFKTLRIDGLMTAEQWAGVIDQFQDTKENGPTVLLAGLRVLGAGVNLSRHHGVFHGAMVECGCRGTGNGSRPLHWTERDCKDC